MKKTVAMAFGFALALVAFPAFADDDVDGAVSGKPQPKEREVSPWVTRPWALELTLGIATPLGFVGASVERSFGSLATSLGVGTNLNGIEGALQTRFLFHDSSPSVYVGVSASLGRHVQNGTGEGVPALFTRPLGANDHSGVHVRHEWRVAPWANLEVGIERRSGTTMSRYFTGIAVLLKSAPSSTVVENDGGYGPAGAIDRRPKSAAIWYGGVAFGPTF